MTTHPAPGEVDEGELLRVAERAARAAGDELLARWRSAPVDIRFKSTPTDPVSAADLAAEAAIRGVLQSERPQDAILGEEGGHTRASGVRTPDGQSALRWVVDPLDGTVNFLYGIARFGVSVACEDADGAVAGVVLDPVTGELFAATRSGPAERCGSAASGGAALRGEQACDQPGETLTGSSPDSLAAALVATGFAYEPELRAAQANVVARVLPRARDIRRAGAAALDLCSCACGEYDAYYERGVQPWDVAAGELICRRAGLDVRQLEPVPAAGPDEPELPYGLLVASPAIIDDLYALVAPR